MNLVLTKMILAGVALAACGSPIPSVFAQSAAAVGVDNTARYGNGHYEWTIFVTGNEAMLQKIDHVEYVLHPSFPHPLQIVGQRGGKCAFGYADTSWGEFNVKVKIVFKNGQETYIDHWLNLLKNSNTSGCDQKKPLTSPKRRIRRAE